MDRYTLYCTPEQTEKAIQLGAPVKCYPIQLAPNDIPTVEKQLQSGKWVKFACPTTEQMIRWLRSKNILFRFDDEEDYWSICDANDVTNDDSTPLRQYSWTENKELKAIDAALDHLKSMN